MYPQKELTVLAGRKAVLLDRICVDRDKLMAAAARIAEPIEIVDRVVDRWRHISPMAKLAAVPLGLLLRRLIARRARKLSAALRWGPLLFAAVRGFYRGRGFSRRT
ncbi:MAG TPA: hypothetical protein VGF85_11135 [Opitutaceae bacterium]|jgi:hypothetical protein